MVNSGSLPLFKLGLRGVNVVTAPTHLTPDELLFAQNAEVVSVGGENAIDQRPGMTRVNTTSLGASVLALHDVLSPFLTDYTPYLYAGMYSGATHNWRRSSDGVTWTDADKPVKPWSNNASITGFFKRFPRAVTVGTTLYYCDGAGTIGMHAFDGTNDVTVSPIPPAVTGAALALTTPLAPGVAVGTTGATTYSYKVVAISGANHSAASPAGTTTIGPAALTCAGNAFLGIVPGDSPPVAGATSYDVYRTVGGATQGKIGSIPVVAGAFTFQNGGACGFAGVVFGDNGLVGDGTTAPASATAGGATAGNCLGVLDMITDGTTIYVAVLDTLAADPNPTGRILSFLPSANVWTQIGLPFVIASGNGTAGVLTLFDGALSYGTYIGITAANTAYLTTTATPLPGGGIPEIHTTAASLAPCAIAIFNGEVYAGYVSLVAATAAIVAKRATLNTWSTARTGPATAQFNAYTSLAVFNGYLFAGWTSGGGATAARIESTPDGINWTSEIALDVAEVVCQMVTFNGSLYVVLGKTGVGYNTKSRILKRTTGGVWSTADDPADDFAGCIGLVYL